MIQIPKSPEAERAERIAWWVQTVLAIIAVCTLLAATVGIGYAFGEGHAKQEAVRNGAGHWEVDDEGKTHFHWGPKP